MVGQRSTPLGLQTLREKLLLEEFDVSYGGPQVSTGSQEALRSSSPTFAASSGSVFSSCFLNSRLHQYPALSLMGCFCFAIELNGAPTFHLSEDNCFGFKLVIQLLAKQQL